LKSLADDLGVHYVCYIQGIIIIMAHILYEQTDKTSKNIHFKLLLNIVLCLDELLFIYLLFC